MDLGIKSKSEPNSPASVEKPKISYPDFTLRDEAAKAFLKEHDVDLGGEITATVKLKCTALRQDEYGSSISFDVLSLDSDKESKEDKDDDDGAEEKVLGYKRPASKKESPSFSAKDLE